MTTLPRNRPPTHPGEILRKDFREPRIHFAIVCASLSCPDLRPEVYVGARIDEQLDAAARGFLADESKGLSTAGGDVAISKLFDWFEEDFDAGGGVVAFLRRYAPEAKDGTLAGDVSPDFLTYDWTLNGR